MKCRNRIRRSWRRRALISPRVASCSWSSYCLKSGPTFQSPISQNGPAVIKTNTPIWQNHWLCVRSRSTSLTRIVAANLRKFLIWSFRRRRRAFTNQEPIHPVHSRRSPGQTRCPPREASRFAYSIEQSTKSKFRMKCQNAPSRSCKTSSTV